MKCLRCHMQPERATDGVGWVMPEGAAAVVLDGYVEAIVCRDCLTEQERAQLAEGSSDAASPSTAGTGKLPRPS